MCDSIDEAIESSDELKQLIKKDPEIAEVFKYAKHLEGTVRSVGVHASGFCITPKPITEIVPLYADKKGEPFTMFDHHALEDIGILKYDLLGIKTLTVIDKTLKLIKKRTGKEIDINQIPEDDEKTYQLIADGNTIGVFQLGGSEGLRKFGANAKPKNISDISNVISLYRP